ncbi:flavivirus dead domain [Caudoviricetes sp.]|nr:flavivirus dead domain [Caudoviricetes sp.]
MREFETGTGKTIQMIIDPKTAHIKLQFKEGGQLPDELSGLYTSERNATKDILSYLDKIKDRKPKNKE